MRSSACASAAGRAWPRSSKGFEATHTILLFDRAAQPVDYRREFDWIEYLNNDSTNLRNL
jgi:hypothetical protein